MNTSTKAGPSDPSSLAWLKGLGNAVADLLFPPYCVSCHRFGAWFCAECATKIELIHPPVCARCGLPLAAAVPPSAGGLRAGSHSPDGCLCDQCRRARSAGGRFRSCALYNGALRVAIHQFKYEGVRALAQPLGEIMRRSWATLAPPDEPVDLIVPVPLHPVRQRERGYNQAALLARELGSHLGRPVETEALVRTRATLPQVGLSANERRANVQGAFQFVDGMASQIAGKRVLLVDDVYTTGSTLEAACDALRDGGVLSVWAFTLARAAKGSASPDQYTGKESGKWN